MVLTSSNQAEDREQTACSASSRVARIHSAMIASVVYATFPAAPRDDPGQDGRDGGTAPTSRAAKGADPPPVQLADVLKGFQTVAVPAQIAHRHASGGPPAAFSIPRITPVVAFEAAGPAA